MRAARCTSMRWRHSGREGAYFYVEQAVKPDDDALPSDEPDADRIEPTTLRISKCNCGWVAVSRSIAAHTAAVYQHCRYRHSEVEKVVKGYYHQTT